MKQSIQLRLGQHLTMTPQLQQAIRLLQLSSLELQNEIQEVLDSNMMLELSEDDTDGNADFEAQPSSQAERPLDSTEQEREQDHESDGDILSTDAASDTIPEELAVDSSWDDIYEAPLPTSATGSGEDGDFDYQGSTEESLRDHLSWQLEMSHFSDNDRIIAESLIDAIDEDGYLGTPVEDIHSSLVQSQPELELDEVEAVLHQIQNFDPLGVAAKDLRDCLQIQLRHLPADTPWLKQAMQLLNEHFELLAKRDYTQLSRKLRLDDDSLKLVVQLILTLNPRPGGQISSSTTEYIVPDVYVRKIKGHWRVELNPDTAPKLRVNPYYASLVQRGNATSDNVSLKNHLQEARWFLKSLQSRNETLLKVATRIVERQSEFFELGPEAMKPMVLHDIAEEVGMHESTISRVTNKKYLHSPRGIFELKYFFSSHVTSDEGDEYSSTAIHALIKKLVAAEDPRKPLSDSKIVTLLADQGINVARRTIAKYREALNISPSNQRKRLA